MAAKQKKHVTESVEIFIRALVTYEDLLTLADDYDVCLVPAETGYAEELILSGDPVRMLRFLRMALTSKACEVSRNTCPAIYGLR